MVWSWVFVFFDIWFLPRLPVRCGTDMSVKETRGWCKRAWAKGVNWGGWEWKAGGGRVGAGVGGRLLWKQPQGQTEHDQRPSDALQTQLEEREKKIPQKEKSLKKGAKTRQSISTRTKNKNVFKVKPWEQRGPWLQPDKSRQADEEQSSGARERTAAEDKGSAYPALLSFVCWFHFFFPDWVKPMAAVCQV